MTCVLLIGFVPPDSIQAAEKKWTSVLPEKLRSVLMLEDENVRILETDDLYTVTAENSDGTLSVNTFSMPIRYEKDGQYGYIDTSMCKNNPVRSVLSGYAARNGANRFVTEFSSNPQKGIRMTDKDSFRLDMAVCGERKSPVGRI